MKGHVMLDVDDALRQKMPALAACPNMLRALTYILRGLTNEARFNLLLAHAGVARGLDFVDQVLELTDTNYRVDADSTVPVPMHGPLLVVANHPLGMRDALVLLQWLGSIRRDVRMLGNDWLASVPPLSSLLLPVDVFGHGKGSVARHIYRALENGEAVILFPAGEVSRLHSCAVRDGPWSDGFARLAFRSRTPVLPVHVKARNSALFYAASILSKSLSTALLPREATAKAGRRIGLSIGAVISADELERRSEGSSRRAADLVRKDVYRIGQNKQRDFEVRAPIADADHAESITAEMRHTEKLADLKDGKQLFLFRGGLDNPLMREIGRLRELTFRKVGEGSGKGRDLDAYDAHYEHLVLWDSDAKCIAGSYRLGHAGRLIGEQAKRCLYTATLFDFSSVLHPRLLQGLELGRSFVAPAYWRTRALEQLWQGIGLYLQKHPELLYLFGAVSMPITLPREAREWIAAAYLQCFGVPNLATAWRPFIVPPDVVRHVQKACGGMDSPAAMRRLKQQLDTLGVSLPMLYRQYVDLAKPGGVQFLAFGDDPEFSGCVDGLVWLDLAMLKASKRARYLGDRSCSPPLGVSALTVSVADLHPRGLPKKMKEVASDAFISS
jgi:putative hemolysin